MAVSKKATNVLIVVLLASGVIMYSITKILERSNNEAMEYSDFQLNSSTPEDMSEITISYEFLGSTEDVVTKGYSFLVEKEGNSEGAMLQLAKKVYADHCDSDRCTMNIFDSKRAYELYTKRLELIKADWGEDYGTPEFRRAQQKWDKSNYAYIADHLICVYHFGGDIFYYPFKDEYYMRLRGVKATPTPATTEESDTPTHPTATQNQAPDNTPEPAVTE